MRVLMKISLPHETYNAAVKDGTAGSKTGAILDEVKPEAVYFTEFDGQRTVIMVVELERPAMIPKLAEPWYLTFQAGVEFHVVMSHQDLQDAGSRALPRSGVRGRARSRGNHSLPSGGVDPRRVGLGPPSKMPRLRAVIGPGERDPAAGQTAKRLAASVRVWHVALPADTEGGLKPTLPTCLMAKQGLAQALTRPDSLREVPMSCSPAAPQVDPGELRVTTSHPVPAT